ncbi:MULTISPECIES: RNA polymerase factor sigma-54 [Paenibacillus]|uniref:RNA polymerase factor sigma-54 n=1 Tax=Paenibacillus polymyxa TaxID=1406 RepID=A0A8I1IY09_PAEPO|nr:MULTISPECIES: RNA polymerase factor sigma-54 [Paenibacillus]KAF6573687.1 RNA polymerase factor sigma-54 [Paenibacillus sp. EKM206P]KAF6588427.1 RNA polymerase factor sigma-54 [Paenibacillus sp. EKM205P]KEO79647.1 DNA-directed RNA polymerase subunit sigma [Paenibacillus polymyxa]MBM0634805.1 RNA polymerase factor sigma-54 [Paenibacillus polymyxa]MCH6188546.1 RNA polymerase factor sigma-54 [Paenibacillus polymyxa]
MRYGLQQEQTFRLAMTPELRQAITILQYSSVDLMSYLHEQANENPIIDLAEIDMSIERINTEEEYSLRKNDNPVDLLDFVSNPADNLYRHLKAQLGMVRGLSKLQQMIGMFLIGNLNEKGYLELDVNTAAGILDVPTDEVENILALIQGFEPAGIAARSLEECLLLQLRYAGNDDVYLEEIVRHHMVNLSCNRIQKIADALGIDIHMVQQMTDQIRKLNPCPGAAFAPYERQYHIADISVEKSKNDYVVTVNDITVPRVGINPFYQSMLRKPAMEEEKRFLREKMNTALWLIHSLEQRRLTLMRVAQAIVDRQREFFEHGVYHLKSMTQKEIAGITGLHESTISRAVSNKYMQTPRGLFELKYFFTSALGSKDGDATSSESAKMRIKQIIDSEEKQKPFSDQAITERMAKEGLELSRRTVAKYREELGYLSSARRKVY